MSSTNYTWSTLEYLDAFVTLVCSFLTRRLIFCLFVLARRHISYQKLKVKQFPLWFPVNEENNTGHHLVYIFLLKTIRHRKIKKP